MKKLIYLYIFLLIINSFAFSEEINDINEPTCNINEFLNLKTENCECLEGFQGSSCSNCLNDLNDENVYICCNVASSLKEPKKIQLFLVPKKEERNFLTGVYTIENCLKQNTTISLDESEDQLFNLDCNCRIVGNNTIMLFEDNSISSLIPNSLLNQNNLFNKRFGNRVVDLKNELIVAKALLPCDTFNGEPIYNTGAIIFLVVFILIILVVIIAGNFMCYQIYRLTTNSKSSKKIQKQIVQLSEKKKLLRKTYTK